MIKVGLQCQNKVPKKLNLHVVLQIETFCIYKYMWHWALSLMLQEWISNKLNENNIDG